MLRHNREAMPNRGRLGKSGDLPFHLPYRVTAAGLIAGCEHSGQQGFMRHQQKEYLTKKERTTFGSAFLIFHLVKVSLTGCSPAVPVYVSLNNSNLINDTVY